MRKNNIYIIVILLFFVCTSCEDWLAVSPKSEIEAEKLFETEQGFDDALIGVYISLSDQSSYGQYLTWHILEDLAHVYTAYRGDYDELQVYDYENSTAEYVIEQIWLQEYKSIAKINLLIESVDKYGNILETEKRNQIKGEALALRALCHFDLLRLYGYGNLENRTDYNSTLTIPYVSDFTKDITAQKSYDETFKLLEKDIVEALSLLKPEVEDEDVETFQMNYDALLVLQGRVLLWEGKKAEALKAVEPLLLKSYSWGGKSVSAESNTFSAEHLFQLNVTELGDYIENFYEHHLSGTFNRNWLYQKTSFVEGIYNISGGSGEGLSDERYLYQHEVSDYSSSYVMTTKLRAEEDSGIADYIIPMLKISEAYLIAIECYASDIEGGDLSKAIEYLNSFKEERNIRPQYFLDETASAEDVQEAVYDEYRKEFIQEGQLFYFYKRKGLVTFPRARSYRTDMDDEKYVLPYPDIEIEFGRVQSI